MGKAFKEKGGALSDGDNYLYKVALFVTHPVMSVDEISNKLSLPAHYGAGAGSPVGSSKNIGSRVRGTTHWRYVVRVEGQRRFSETVSGLLSHVEEIAGQVKEIAESGGRISIILSLFGNKNVGDCLGSEVLGGMAGLGISFGVEVFPE